MTKLSSSDITKMHLMVVFKFLLQDGNQSKVNFAGISFNFCVGGQTTSLETTTKQNICLCVGFARMKINGVCFQSLKTRLTRIFKLLDFLMN